MSEKWTPGPWAIDDYATTDDGHYSVMDGDHEKLVCELVSRKADAHLIAAAPDMAEALQGILDWAEFAQRHPEEFNAHGVKNLMGPAFDKAVAALDRARGASND